MVQKESVKGTALLLGSAAAFALSTVVAKMVTHASAIGGAELSFFRFALGLIGATFYLCRRQRSFRPCRPGLVILRGLFNTIAVVLFFCAVEHTTVTNANMLNMTYPVLLFLVVPWINRERIRAPHYLALVLTMAGIYLILSPDFSTVNAGDMLGALSGLTAAFAIAYLREARKHDDTDVILFYVMAIGTPLSLAVALPVFVIPRGILLTQVLASAVLALIGQILLTEGYRHIEAARGGLVSAARIPVAALLGYACFQDPLHASILMGGVLIIASLVLVSRGNGR